MGDLLIDKMKTAEEEDAKLAELGPGIVDILWDRLDSVRHIALGTMGAYIMGLMGTRGQEVGGAALIGDQVSTCFGWLLCSSLCTSWTRSTKSGYDLGAAPSWPGSDTCWCAGLPTLLPAQEAQKQGVGAGERGVRAVVQLFDAGNGSGDRCGCA